MCLLHSVLVPKIAAPGLNLQETINVIPGPKFQLLKKTPLWLNFPDQVSMKFYRNRSVARNQVASILLNRDGAVQNSWIYHDVYGGYCHKSKHWNAKNNRWRYHLSIFCSVLQRCDTGKWYFSGCGTCFVMGFTMTLRRWVLGQFLHFCSPWLTTEFHIHIWYPSDMNVIRGFYEYFFLNSKYAKWIKKKHAEL